MTLQLAEIIAAGILGGPYNIVKVTIEPDGDHYYIVALTRTNREILITSPDNIWKLNHS